ncbi:MAG: polysaccharide deacetylase family protein [Flavipsychrobacter sp.]|nr:polysaccharide deacetylase family protein [Flavipsychrobacter sp.]
MEIFNSFMVLCMVLVGIGMTAPLPSNGQVAPGNLYLTRLKHVPVLCYHQVRDWGKDDSKTARTFIMPVALFSAEMQMLHDSGYHTISADQLIAYVTTGALLPAKPVVLTFDDGTASQYENALPELNKYGFKAVFFIMTVVLDKKNYLSKNQVKKLTNEGHEIGCHTWDHHNVTQYKGDDWKIQVQQPVSLLKSITGMPVKYFAYPYGLWNKNAADALKNYGFSAAFQLWGAPDEQSPLLAIKRILVDGNWSAAQLSAVMKRNYQY